MVLTIWTCPWCDTPDNETETHCHTHHCTNCDMDFIESEVIFQKTITITNAP